MTEQVRGLAIVSGFGDGIWIPAKVHGSQLSVTPIPGDSPHPILASEITLGTHAQNIHAQKAPIHMDSKNKTIILNGIILTSNLLSLETYFL